MNMSNIRMYVSLQLFAVFVFSMFHEICCRKCLCVHNGVVLPVDQHRDVTELPGGTCVEIVNEHIHFKNMNWTLIMYLGHHAFVEEIRMEYDKVECDENNNPLYTTPISTLPPSTVPIYATNGHQTVGTTLKPPPYCPPNSGTPTARDFTCPDVKFIPRKAWGASSQYETINNLSSQFSCAVDFAIIHQSLGATCTTQAECIQRLQADIQTWRHRQFNFAIGDDGTIFELNGFQSVGNHASFFDNISLGIAFIGDFSTKDPSQAAIDSLEKFLACAVRENFLSASYVLRNERDILGTGLGAALYKTIERLPHY